METCSFCGVDVEKTKYLLGAIVQGCSGLICGDCVKKAAKALKDHTTEEKVVPIERNITRVTHVATEAAGQRPEPVDPSGAA